MIMGSASANNMISFDYMFDFGLEKQSLPPAVALKMSFDGKNATWDATGLQFTLKGTVSDPDGESVSMTLQLCGSTATDFTIAGINWEIDVSIATCVLQEISTYDVVITATDESYVESTLEVMMILHRMMVTLEKKAVHYQVSPYLLQSQLLF